MKEKLLENDIFRDNQIEDNYAKDLFFNEKNNLTLISGQKTSTKSSCPSLHIDSILLNDGL